MCLCESLPPVPTPDGADGEAMRDLATFLEVRYEQAMIKDLTGIITRNQREKRRAGNQAGAANHANMTPGP